MDDRENFSIENLRVGQELMQQAMLEQQARKSKRKGWQRLCTVLPREWELRLLEAKRVSTYRLAIELLYLHWYGKGKPVTVSGKVARAVKISATSKWEALNELERLGLIEVDRKLRKAPRAVLHHTQAPKSWPRSRIGTFRDRGQIPANLFAIAVMGSLFSFLVLSL